jgi:hypothetical protein
MSDVSFTLKNIKPSPMHGYQLKAVAISARGYKNGFSQPFDALIDPGAFHTCISKAIMEDILDEVVDENGNALREAGKANALGVYGDTNREPVYILPHLYVGGMHLTNVAVTVLDSNNFQCLIGRSILHQCVLTLDPELNNMHFNFKESLKQHKEPVDGICPFDAVLQFAEFST